MYVCIYACMVVCVYIVWLKVKAETQNQIVRSADTKSWDHCVKFALRLTKITNCDTA